MHTYTSMLLGRFKLKQKTRIFRIVWVSFIIIESICSASARREGN